VKLSARDIDAIYYALRPRLLGLTTVAVAAPRPPAPHTHSADEITFEPALNIAGDDVQEGMEELDTENLARDGTQAMLGHLNMNGYQIYNILNLLVTGGLGSAIVSAVRVLTMAGDDNDNEARIQALERVIFNSEPTKSVIENPSRLEWNTNVTPGGHYTIETGRMSWSTLERTMVVAVASGIDTVLAGTVAATTTLYPPVLNGIVMPVIGPDSALYAPTIAGDAQDVEMDDFFLDSSVEMYHATVGQLITQPIASSVALYEPTVALA
jgi:hypothetical protein